MSGLVWGRGGRREGDCCLLDVEGVDKAFELYYGVARSSGWGSDALCRMDPGLPKEIALSDSPVGAGVILVSAGLRQHLVELGADGCEFLPITIVNHKNRIAARDYCVLNPVAFCDCIDVRASNVKRNHIDPDSFFKCSRLVLKWDAVPAELNVFRLKHWPNVVVVRREVAEALLSAGWSGLHFIDPMAFTG